jgi:hypothetical protein
MDECKENVVYLHNGVYSATKKNEIMLFAGKGMEPEIIMLSEISQSYKDKYWTFSLICGSWGWGRPRS